MVNQLHVINKPEPVEYDQTYDLVDEYTPDTPQSHQSGFIAQSVQQIDELKHTVIGGKLGEDGKESLRGLNYNAVFAYAVKSDTRVEPNSAGATGADRRAASTASEPLVDKLCDDYIVIDAKLVLYALHVVVVRMQVHGVVLQSIEPMHDMRTARIDVPVAVLILDVAVDILLALEKVGQVRGYLIQLSPHRHIDPLQGLVGLIAIGIEVLVDTIVP